MSLIALLVVIAVLLSATLMALIIAMILYIKRLDKAVGEIEKTLSTVRQEMLPLTTELKRLIVDADGLVITAKRQLERMVKVTEAAEALLEGRTFTRVASNAVSSSKVTIASVLQGIKTAFQTYRNSGAESKEESSDE